MGHQGRGGRSLSREPPERSAGGKRLRNLSGHHEEGGLGWEEKGSRERREKEEKLCGQAGGENGTEA